MDNNNYIINHSGTVYFVLCQLAMQPCIGDIEILTARV